MTTRFPNLPVLGHVPKKRKVDLTKTVTLAQAYEIIDGDSFYEVLYQCSGDNDFGYALQRLREELKKVAK